MRLFRENVKIGPLVKFISILQGYLKHRNNIDEELDLCEWLYRRCGVFAGDQLELFLEAALRRSPYVQQNLDLLPRRVVEGIDPLTFGHFTLIREQGKLSDPITQQDGPFYLPPLFLTATNLTTRSLELINSVEKRYTDWSIARAVRASAGFPLFFRPVTNFIEKNEYSLVDGGMIANYPAFVFGEQFRGWLAEKLPDFDTLASRPWLHVGLRLTSHKRTVGRAGEAQDPRAFSGTMRELLVSQARNELEEKLAKYVRRSIAVEMSLAESGGPSGVLDVENLRPCDLEAMYHNGLRVGRRVLEQFSWRYPCVAEIERRLEKLIDTVERLFSIDSKELKLRSNVFVPKADKLLLWYRARMDRTPSDAKIDDNNDQLNWDWDLVLPYQHGLTGFCFVRRRPLLCNLKRFAKLYEGDQKVDPCKLFGFDEATQRKIRRDRSWLLSVPIFDPGALTIRPIGRELDAARGSAIQSGRTMLHSGRTGLRRTRFRGSKP